jgi:hypothetical protein
MTLQSKNLRGVIYDQPVFTNGMKWTVIEVPRSFGFSSPGDPSTFHMKSDPWTVVQTLFPKVLKLYVSEGGREWELTCGGTDVEQKVFSFNQDSPSEPNANEQVFLRAFFDLPADFDFSVFSNQRAAKFCNSVGLYFAEMLWKDHSDRHLKPAEVILTSESSS